MTRFVWAVLLVAACGGQTITGSFVLRGSGETTGTTCAGTGGYSDIRTGVNVVVKDGTGKVIGTGTLLDDPDADTVFGRCSYVFSVPVTDADFYSVEVGRRGALTYSRAELEAQGWTVGFTLGG